MPLPKWQLLLCMPLLWAQDKPKPPRFAIEISNKGGLVVERRNVAENAEVSQVLMWRGPALGVLLDPGNADPATVGIGGFALLYRCNGDSVALKAEGYRRLATPRETASGVAAGSAVLHLNESAVFSEMAGLHLQPLTVKIVKARSSLPSLFTMQNKTHSIGLTILEQIDYAGEPGHSFRLQVRNNAAQAAVGVETCVLCRNGKGCGEREYRDAIPPEGTGEMTFLGQSCGAAALSLPIVALEGAVFEDGRYEGDMASVAPMAAEVIAARIQIRRILALVSHILADPTADDASKLAQVQAGVRELPDKADKDVLAAVRRPLHGAQEQARRMAEAHASIALWEPKQRTLNAIAAFERSSSNGGTGKSLADWWNEWSRSVLLP